MNSVDIYNPMKLGEATPETKPNRMASAKDAKSLDLGDASQAQKSKSGTEEESIFGFFKRYLGLLATVGGIPLVASTLKILPPPESFGEGKIKMPSGEASGLASLFCIVTLSICIFCRNALADCAYKRSALGRMIPVYWSIFFLVSGVALTTLYVGNQNLILPEWRLAVYFTIMPAFTAALGIILMASYAQFYGSELESTIDRSIINPGDRTQIRSLISGYARLLGVRESVSTPELARKLAAGISEKIDSLSRGEIKASGVEIIGVQRLLLENFPNDFHAVSDRDIRFWLRGTGGLEDGVSVRFGLALYFSPDVFKTFHNKKLADKTAYRNEVVEGRMRAINLYYLQLERALTVERNVENMGVDFAVIGTSLAASIAGGSEAKSIMALISGGLVAAKGSIDKNLFYEKTMPALVAQMRAERAKVLVKIRKGLELDANKYSLASALDDLDEYAAAGSLPGAINGVVQNAGAEAKEAKSLLKGVMISTYEADDNTEKLSKFWLPDGKIPNTDNQKKLAAELAKKGIAEDELATVINFPEFKPLRAELVKALGL